MLDLHVLELLSRDNDSLYDYTITKHGEDNKKKKKRKKMEAILDRYASLPRIDLERRSISLEDQDWSSAGIN